MSDISVLIIDDDPAIRKVLKLTFMKEHMKTACAEGTDEALALLEQQVFDIILLDIIMPGQDGFAFLKTIREQKIYTPVILVSGRVEDTAQIEGLGLGADDYLTKPFNKDILISKIRALLRRTGQYAPVIEPTNTILQKGAFSLHLDTQAAYKNKNELFLTTKEFSLFYLFLEHPGYTFTKQELFAKVWKQDVTDDNTILVYIKRLRDKIEDDPSKPLHIRTVWGRGYQFFP